VRCLTLAGAPPLRVASAGKLCFVTLKTAVPVAGSKPPRSRTRVTQLLMDASPAVNGATIPPSLTRSLPNEPHPPSRRSLMV
jgi:hypothetical protein